MATFNKRFEWHWTDDEKSSRRVPLRRIKSLHRRVNRQLFRIQQDLPTYFEEAQAARDLLEDGLGSAPEMDLTNNSNKYQPISPEQFDQAALTVDQLAEPWHELTHTQAFVAGVKESDRRVRKQNNLARKRPTMFSCVVPLFGNL